MLLDQIRNIVGPKGWSTDADVLKAHCAEWRGIVHGLTPMVVSPASTEEVSLVVRACADAGVAIVPQGGNTSLCAGAIPDDSGKQIILSLARMNQIRSIDAPNFSMEVEAGCILQNVQRAAAEVDRHFALSLGAEGSCQIGGNLATNAGGVNVGAILTDVTVSAIPLPAGLPLLVTQNCGYAPYVADNDAGLLTHQLNQFIVRATGDQFAVIHDADVVR